MEFGLRFILGAIAMVKVEVERLWCRLSRRYVRRGLEEWGSASGAMAIGKACWSLHRPRAGWKGGGKGER